MSDSLFESSDSVRGAFALKHAQTVTFEEPFVLENGGVLHEVTVVYETYGTLNEARDNAVLICHALTGDSHVAMHDADDDPGWWDIVVGPGKPIDTDRCFVICPNVLGGCRGTTGPNSVNPDTGKPYGADFPVITVGDMVQLQRRLVDFLGIGRLLAVVGGSMGGHQVLDWATRFPDRLVGAVAVATSSRLTAQALAFDVVGRNAIVRDPHYRGGQYYDHDALPTDGLAIARMLGHITYLSSEAMTRKFDAARLAPRDVRTEFETKFSVGSYLAYQGDRFRERFDANSYLTLSMAMDLFDFGDTPQQMADAFASATCRWLVVSFSSDWLFPPMQSRGIVNTLINQGRRVSYCEVQSNCGHDAFLLEDNFESYGGLIDSFLQNLAHPDVTDVDWSAALVRSGSPLSDDRRHMFARHGRLDFDTIADLIEQGASVLDLGCGTGGLLAELRHRGHRRIMGVELDERAIVTCVARGFDVVHADLNLGLPNFRRKQFDFVVLSHTLQTIFDVRRIVMDTIRVGRYGVVSFPNLGYRRFREEVAAGRAPGIDENEGYHWYDTPNVRFFSIDDFEQFCQDHAIRVYRRMPLDTHAGTPVEENPNENADLAIFVIGEG